MKKKLLPVCLALLVLYCLLFPTRMAHAVTDGLALWYQSILPTLLPFCIFSNIIIQTGVYDRIFEKIHPVFRHIYPVRAPLIYPLVAGFLFGFPLGSKICADLFASGRISAREAETISCISNNFGPAFLYNYVAVGLLGEKISIPVLFVCFYAPSLILGRILLSANRTLSHNSKKPPSESPISMKILDAGIMDGFTTMLKLAGYILLSALLADMLKTLPLTHPLISAIATGIVEITNGINQIALLDTNPQTKAVLAIGVVNFGGISGLFQTSSMMKSTGFHRGRYLVFKTACSLLGIVLISILL